MKEILKALLAMEAATDYEVRNSLSMAAAMQTSTAALVDAANDACLGDSWNLRKRYHDAPNSHKVLMKQAARQAAKVGFPGWLREILRAEHDGGA